MSPDNMLQSETTLPPADLGARLLRIDASLDNITTVIGNLDDTINRGPDSLAAKVARHLSEKDPHGYEEWFKADRNESFASKYFWVMAVMAIFGGLTGLASLFISIMKATPPG